MLSVYTAHDNMEVATGQYAEQTHPLKRNAIIWSHGYRTADRTKYNRQIAKANIARQNKPLNQNTLHTNSIQDNRETQWSIKRRSLRLVRCCQKVL